jgi:hypothetical protein
MSQDRKNEVIALRRALEIIKTYVLECDAPECNEDCYFRKPCASLDKDEFIELVLKKAGGELSLSEPLTPQVNLSNFQWIK